MHDGLNSRKTARYEGKNRATLHHVNSPEIDAVLQSQFGTVRVGITGFNMHHIDHNSGAFRYSHGPTSSGSVRITSQLNPDRRTSKQLLRAQSVYKSY